MTERDTRSGIILVGGKARRMNGDEKYFHTFGGVSFLDIIITALSPVTDEILLVARDEIQCGQFSSYPDLRVVSDIQKEQGPIGGLHAGLLETTSELAFVVACDMPCIQPTVVELLFQAAEGFDAVVPLHENGHIEPLHAVYRTAPALNYLEQPHSRRMKVLADTLNTRMMPMCELRTADPDLKSFTNINHPEDLEQLRRDGGC